MQSDGKERSEVRHAMPERIETQAEGEGTVRHAHPELELEMQRPPKSHRPKRSRLARHSRSQAVSGRSLAVEGKGGVPRSCRRSSLVLLFLLLLLRHTTSAARSQSVSDVRLHNAYVTSKMG